MDEADFFHLRTQKLCVFITHGQHCQLWLNNEINEPKDDIEEHIIERYLGVHKKEPKALIGHLTQNGSSSQAPPKSHNISMMGETCTNKSLDKMNVAKAFLESVQVRHEILFVQSLSHGIW